MKVYCAKRLANALSSSRDGRRRFLGMRSRGFPSVMAAVDDSSARVARAAFSILEAAVAEGEDEADAQHQTYR